MHDRPIGERLRALRKAARLTQPELAARIGRTQSWVSQREAGKYETSVAEAEMVAVACGFSAGLIVVSTPAAESSDPVGRLVTAATRAEPEDVDRVIDALEAMSSPALAPDLRRMLRAMIETAVAQARRSTG